MRYYDFATATIAQEIMRAQGKNPWGPDIPDPDIPNAFMPCWVPTADLVQAVRTIIKLMQEAGELT